MPSTLIPDISAAVELLPPLALLLNPSRLSPRLKVALLGLLFFLFDMLLRVPQLSMANGHNIWLGYVLAPIQTVLVTSLLADWQKTARAGRVVRVLGVIVAGILVTLTLAIENPDTFGLVIGVVGGLFLLGTALYTLVIRSLDERHELRRFDWFWVCSGLALYFAADSGYDPVQRWMVAAGDTSAYLVAYFVKTFAQSGAMLLLAGGLLCPGERKSEVP